MKGEKKRNYPPWKRNNIDSRENDVPNNKHDILKTSGERKDKRID